MYFKAIYYYYSNSEPRLLTNERDDLLFQREPTLG